MFLSHWKRALALGFLSWLLPFAVGFLLFPIKQSNAPLFESLMGLAIVAVAAVIARAWFRDASPPRWSEATLLGALCLAMNLVLDYPMFAYGPMQMTPSHY